MSPALRAGVLRPRQRVLPGVGRDRARRRRRSTPGSTNGSTAWRTTPSTSRSSGARTGTRCGPEPAHVGRGRLRAVRVSDARRGRPRLLEVRDHDRGERPPAGVRCATASWAWGCRTSCATWRSAPSRPTCSWCTSRACSARVPSGCRCRSAIRRSSTGATAVTSMFELFAFYLQAGLIDVAFLGGAQIDRFGNLNTTVIGDYDHPKVRLPGSGGACEIAIHARQDPRDHAAGARARSWTRSTSARRRATAAIRRTTPRAGWSGSGPTSVVTDLGTYVFDEATGEMTLRDAASRRHARGRPREHGLGAEGRATTWARRPPRPTRSSG